MELFVHNTIIIYNYYICNYVCMGLSVVCMYRPAICIFYLVLRALDTVEDDMTISRKVKVELLQQFHTHLYQPQWNYTDSNEKDKAVLEEFPKVIY